MSQYNHHQSAQQVNDWNENSQNQSAPEFYASHNPPTAPQTAQENQLPVGNLEVHSGQHDGARIHLAPPPQHHQQYLREEVIYQGNMDPNQQNQHAYTYYAGSVQLQQNRAADMNVMAAHYQGQHAEDLALLAEFFPDLAPGVQPEPTIQAMQNESPDIVFEGYYQNAEAPRRGRKRRAEEATGVVPLKRSNWAPDVDDDILTEEDFQQRYGN